MVIDIRYHLTTIIAIFLSLGIGILIGSAMIGDDGVVREQQKLIIQIEKDLKNLRNQNYQYRTKVISLEEMIVEQNQFIDQLFKDAIFERLRGLSCLLVQDEKSKHKYEELLKVLRNAGMEITEYSKLSVEEPAGWDICLLLAQGIPPVVEDIFSKEQIFQLSEKDLASKQGLYQLIKSLEELKLKIQGDEENDLSSNTGL
ncbi:hypothetical protein BBF96_09000 [Anoxybacter fermentans]|uniref:Copper transporter n=1 Tax=Anoxybacter fermentans TaxID=1323375 RepID=A0A3S9SZ25_9FIRM|nr:copper transporter [Anoxybacter fermentans]AZR73510.1 hypothetical protein BBF96_09000 [Anoxybacter fermentans]